MIRGGAIARHLCCRLLRQRLLARIGGDAAEGHQESAPLHLPQLLRFDQRGPRRLERAHLCARGAQDAPGSGQAAGAARRRLSPAEPSCAGRRARTHRRVPEWRESASAPAVAVCGRHPRPSQGRTWRHRARRRRARPRRMPLPAGAAGQAHRPCPRAPLRRAAAPQRRALQPAGVSPAPHAKPLRADAARDTRAHTPRSSAISAASGAVPASAGAVRRAIRTA